MIKLKHHKQYKRKIRYNKVDYSTATGVYRTAHDIKDPFCMIEFSSSKIINHLFRVNDDKGESEIVYDMILGRDLMLQLGLTANLGVKSFNGMALLYTLRNLAV